MNSITSFIKRYPQGVFWGIAYVTGNLGYILSRLYPSDLWQFFVWGVFLGGVFVTAIADGRSGLREYFSRMARWRVAIKWYAIALFLPVLINLAAIGLNIVSGAQIETNIQLPSAPQVVFFFLMTFFFIALGEEPGFRGFALPRLLNGRSALSASLILGALHAIWHLPLFIGGDMPLSTILIILAGAVMFTWIFNNTSGSVLIAMIFHTMVDLSVAYFEPVFSGASAQSVPIWQMVTYGATAIFIVILTGWELGRKPEADMDVRTAEQPAMAR
jgi:membrane protease YdiL (CAAX protease family)